MQYLTQLSFNYDLFNSQFKYQRSQNALYYGDIFRENTCVRANLVRLSYFKICEMTILPLTTQRKYFVQSITLCLAPQTWLIKCQSPDSELNI